MNAPNDASGPRWEPGTLATVKLERILEDALADLWQDSYRREQTPQARLGIFRRKVELALYCATGQEIWLTTKYGERG